MSLTILSMTPVLIIAAPLALLVCLHGVWQARRDLSQTTLLSAWRWAVAAVLGWAACWSATVGGMLSAAQSDALWYAVALVALCPAVSVLGARRPGIGVWTGFVVLPLLAVLGWPLLTLIGVGGEMRALRLETPQLVGFVLVLLMGAGNYVGTRFSLSAIAYTLALCLLAGSVSAVAPEPLQGSMQARHLATVLIGVGVLLARRTGSRAADIPGGFDRLWSDYRDTFGIVWARRFQDRMNDIARQQQWPARLGDAGLEWDPVAADVRAGIEPRIDQTLRWLLRRFVDPPWIDERLTLPVDADSPSHVA